jgi:hypothetical protein
LILILRIIALMKAISHQPSRRLHLLLLWILNKGFYLQTPK